MDPVLSVGPYIDQNFSPCIDGKDDLVHLVLVFELCDEEEKEKDGKRRTNSIFHVCFSQLEKA